jgi:outer membrane protein
MIRLKTKFEITKMRKLVLLAVFGMVGFMSHAQTTTQKIGYADVDYIFSQLPDAKQIDTDLKSLQTQLKNQIDAKYSEFQKKLTDYNAAVQANTMPDAVRNNTERELQQLQQNIEKLQQDAQTNLQTKQNQLMQPVYKKVGDAITSVAKENGYNYILTQQIGGIDVILYGEDNLDISDLVLKKLGVTPKPATPATPAPK